ncbi:hypothetical protein GCK32_000602 [Trichostrongylus colubriformis]|uniref:Uncharacterized protein n=1 Tax=Trichostrongylus colubriformis TaxID=6319 RepID=A0AAN8FX76_TRICO
MHFFSIFCFVNLLFLTSRLVTLISSLQLVNAQRTVADTCVCASLGPPDADLLVCVLCRAKYHGTCCKWDPFLVRLPECTYLCVRCLRGRRPCNEDVEVRAIQSLTTRWRQAAGCPCSGIDQPRAVTVF